ncbi:MAG: hypothetical protein ACO3EG_05175 [Chitinophagaceae bacterium]
MKKTSEAFSILIGILFILIGIINTFWGNDPFFGIFILVAATIFFPYTTTQLSKKFNFNTAGWLKLLLALFIIWASIGVGELFDKIDLMRKFFSM